MRRFLDWKATFGADVQTHQAFSRRPGPDVATFPAKLRRKSQTRLVMQMLGGNEQQEPAVDKA